MSNLKPTPPRRIKRVIRKVFDYENGTLRSEAVDFTVKRWEDEWYIHVTQGEKFFLHVLKLLIDKIYKKNDFHDW